MSLPDTPGLRLVSSALVFCRAAKLLNDEDPQEHAWAPCFVNLGLAIELGLKGFLREHGTTEAEQIAFGHDLVKTFNAAITSGFKPTHPCQQVVATEINPHYKDMSLRYQNGTSVNLPPLKSAIGATRWLLDDILTQCAAKHR